jgi:hypothetical protein
MEVGVGSEPIIGARGSGTLCEYLDCEIGSIKYLD